MKCECSGDVCWTEDPNGDCSVQVCAQCLPNAVNGNVVDAISGIHKMVLCSSLCLFVCSTVTVVTVKSIFKRSQSLAESSGVKWMTT